MACRSWTCIRFSTACMPSSSVAPWTIASLDAAAGQPHREAQAVVVAALGPFGIRGPAKLAAPDDQRVLEQSAGFQVLEQRGDRAIALLSVVAVLGDVVVIVPGLIVAVIDLDDAHAPLHQSPRDQAGVGELAGAVQVPRRGRFASQVKRLARLELHAEGHLQRGDPRFERIVVAACRRGARG